MAATLDWSFMKEKQAGKKASPHPRADLKAQNTVRARGGPWLLLKPS